MARACAGLFGMLGDSAHEIRVQADHVLRAFLEEVKQAPQVSRRPRAPALLLHACPLFQGYSRAVSGLFRI